MTASRTARLFALIVACAVLFAIVLIWVRATDDPRPAAVGASPAPSSSPPPREGWQTIEYRGVQVDIPSTWERLDKSECELKFEQWAPPKSQPCSFQGGAAFYRSATFDPFHGPGVWRIAAKGTGAATWNGYVYAGDYAVYALHNDRDLVQGVLDSARADGK